MVPSVSLRLGQVVVGGSSNPYYFLRDFGLPQATTHLHSTYAHTYTSMRTHKIHMVVPSDLPLHKAVQC